MKGITDRQREIAEYIGKFIKEKKYSPSVRDISAQFGFSVKAGHDHLKALEHKHIIRMTPGVSRSIELLDDRYNPTPDVVEVPLLGTIAAGTPLLSEENLDYNLDIPATLLHGGHGTYFALRVRGESMIEAGINTGDIAVLRQCETAENGEIVAVTVGEDSDPNGITLKKFYKLPDKIELRPCNHTMAPIITSACHIHGKLVLLVRSY